MKDAPTDAPNTADTDTAPVADDTAAATLEEPTPADDAADEEAAEAAEAPTPANREAAKYRRRLRDTEAAAAAKIEKVETERNNLAGRLERIQRAEVERIAGGLLADGADFWRDGAELAAVLDADGNVDSAAVTELATAAARSHPHWARTARKVAARGSLASGATNPGDRTVPSWQHVLRSATK